MEETFEISAGLFCLLTLYSVLFGFILGLAAMNEIVRRVKQLKDEDDDEE